jgi:ribosomal protein S1
MDARGNWQMVSGMLRVAKSYTKAAVVRKKVQRLSGKPVELFVHRIFPENGRMEVKLSREEVEEEVEKMKPKISASSLKAGQELVGKVIELKPFGCIVDVGANRNGMLHIQRVANLYGRYIDKEKGLEEVGLELGATIKVAVQSSEKKKLILDFTQETKDLAAKELEAKRKNEEDVNPPDLEKSNVEDHSENISDQEAAAWAAYANNNEEKDEGGTNDDDYYDEDSEIEDMLGIGSY